MTQGGYVAYVLDVLAPLGNVRAKSMFGAKAIYCDDVMFAIVADETLYLKVGAKRPDTFLVHGSEPLTYEARGRTIALSYWSVPEAMLDDEEAMREAARAALVVARTGERPKKHRIK